MWMPLSMSFGVDEAPAGRHRAKHAPIGETAAKVHLLKALSRRATHESQPCFSFRSWTMASNLLAVPKHVLHVSVNEGWNMEFDD